MRCRRRLCGGSLSGSCLRLAMSRIRRGFLPVCFRPRRRLDRFVEQQQFVFDRLVRLLWPHLGTASARHLREDLRQAMCLLAARVAGRGASAAVRRRGSARLVENSPFYQLVFATERLVRADTPARRLAEMAEWRESVGRCIDELEQIHLHMEDAGVSSALVYDLRSMEATLDRMQILAAVYLEETTGASGSPAAEPGRAAVRTLTNTLLYGRLADMRLRTLMRENLNLLARKTVERTGHGGEHYIAHTRQDYWLMWRAAAGGGLLTVFTAALKMRVMEAHLPLAIEGFLIGTDYAVSFLLLQIFGFALATKQPSMTAAALAGIVRENRGTARWSKISEFAADISRTQLAAAFSNVIAVCAGAVLFETVWAHLFKTHYLPMQSAQHVYQTLHPFTSGDGDLCGVHGDPAVAGGGDWRLVRELCRVPPDPGGDLAAPARGEDGRAFDAPGGEVAGAKRGELEHQHCAGLPAGVCARGGAVFRDSAGRSPRDPEYGDAGAGGCAVWNELVRAGMAVLRDRGHCDHVCVEPGRELFDRVGGGAAGV